MFLDLIQDGAPLVSVASLDEPPRLSYVRVAVVGSRCSSDVEAFSGPSIRVRSGEGEKGERFAVHGIGRRNREGEDGLNVPYEVVEFNERSQLPFNEQSAGILRTTSLNLFLVPLSLFSASGETR